MKVKLFCILFIVCMSHTLHASWYANLSIEDLCSGSTNIVEAKVVAVNCFEENDEIYTSISFRVTNKFKGDLAGNSVFEIVRYGGTIGEKTVWQMNAPTYRKNEKVILFLKEFTSKEFGTNFSVLGLFEGKFSINEGLAYRDYELPLKVKKNGRTLNVSRKKPLNKSELQQLIQTAVK